MSRIVLCCASLIAATFAPSLHAQEQGPPVLAAPSTGTAAPSAGASSPIVTPAPADARYGPPLYQLDRTPSGHGARFDEAKYRRYVARIVFGSLVVAGGLALLLASGYYAIGAAGFIAVFGYCGGEDDCREELGEEERRARIRAWIMLASSAVSFGIGVPLIITGHKGRRRQVALRYSAVDTGRIQRGSVVVFVGENAGGLRMSFEF